MVVHMRILVEHVNWLVQDKIAFYEPTNAFGKIHVSWILARSMTKNEPSVHWKIIDNYYKDKENDNAVI